MNQDFIFQQLFEKETSTYTYLIADPRTREAAIIDPVLETVDRDFDLLQELGLNLKYVLDTHIHADHITGAGELRKRTGAKTAVSENAQVSCADLQLQDGQSLFLGQQKISVLETPGHTDTCLTYVFAGMLFTGDALLIRGCGRTDFQQGSSEKLYASVRDKLFAFSDDTKIYPGHDYRGLTSSTIGAEKAHNPRLKESMTLADFVRVMNATKRDLPKKIHEAVPANLVCGQRKETTQLQPKVVDGVPEISVGALWEVCQNRKVRLIDVRRPEEFCGELGHIEGAELVTLGPELIVLLDQTDRQSEIVFVCRSGARSGSATAESLRLGYAKTMNMAGGMLKWNEANFPVVRS